MAKITLKAKIIHPKKHVFTRYNFITASLKNLIDKVSAYPNFNKSKICSFSTPEKRILRKLKNTGRDALTIRQGGKNEKV
jgi:hypothetical protein